MICSAIARGGEKKMYSKFTHFSYDFWYANHNHQEKYQNVAYVY